MHLQDCGMMDGIHFESSCQNNLRTNLNIRHYRHDQSSYAPRISDDQWESVRDVVDSMHKAGRSRSRMLEVLADQHHFRPSMSQINARMIVWGYRVKRAMRNSKNDGAPRVRVSSISESLSDDSQSMQLDSNIDLPELSFNQDSEQSEHIESTCVIEQKIFEVLESETGLSTSEKLLVLNDMADFLVFSKWAPSHRQFLEKCYVYFTGNKNLVVARLLLIQECLIQMQNWHAPLNIDWLHQQFRRCVIDSNSMIDSQNELLIRSCSEIGASICPRKDWTINSSEQHINFVDADLPQAAGLRDIEYSLPTPFNHMLAKNEANATREDDKAFRQMIHPLLGWCIKQQNDLDWTYSLSSIGDMPVDVYLTRYTCIDLTCHLIQNWIDYTRSLANSSHCLCLEHNSDALQPDLILFKSIIKGFASLSYMIVQRSLKLLSTSEHDVNDTGRSEDFSTRVGKAFRSAMEALHLDLMAGVDVVSNTLPSTSNEEPKGEQLQHLTELVSVITKECCVLRRQGLPTYHQHALHWVCEHSKDSKVVYNATGGPDAMLWNASSGASFQSFRREGIKSKDRFGLHTISGPLAGSSYSIRSGRSSIFKIQK